MWGAAVDSGWQVVAFADSNPTQLEFKGINVIREAELPSTGFIVVAIGLNHARKVTTERLTSQFPEIQFATVAHPTASIGYQAQIGPGAVILQNATVGTSATVGEGTIINSGAILDHESTLGDFASLAPGAKTGGRVRIGAESAISLGAAVSHGVIVGPHTVVGGQSFVNKDLPENSVAFGTPARVIRSRQPNESYL